MCNGQLLPINQNQALFSLLGTTYGGDGQTNFALPDLRARVPIHVGSGHTLGEQGGEQAHTLSIAELPTHTHVANAVVTDGSAVWVVECGPGVAHASNMPRCVYGYMRVCVSRHGSHRAATFAVLASRVLSSSACHTRGLGT